MILKAVDINKSFSLKNGETIKVLKGINLEIERGSFTALMGPSGVGKSTLLYILGTIDLPDSGAIFFNTDKQRDIHKLNDKDLSDFRNKNIGFVFQFYHLLPEFTALENVMMPALILGISRGEASKKAQSLMERTGVIHRMNNKPSELSGGEQQRIALARALINNPDIVFADEPTGNLDSESSDSVMSLISDLRKEFGTTFVIATHSMEIANAAERIITIYDGQIAGVN